METGFSSLMQNVWLSAIPCAPLGNPAHGTKAAPVSGRTLGLGHSCPAPKCDWAPSPGPAAPLGGHCQPWLPTQPKESAPISAKSTKIHDSKVGQARDWILLCFPSPSRQPQITCCFSLSPSIQGLCSEPANDFGDSFKDPLVCLSACSCSLVECLMEFIHIL